jgi:transposase-like protein
MKKKGLGGSAIAKALKIGRASVYRALFKAGDACEIIAGPNR